MAIMTGLSGNEIYCLNLKGLTPGDLVIGNSVHSLGVLGTIGSGFKNLLGGEISQITSLIHEGRQMAFDRMVAEATKRGGIGITGASNELVQLVNTIEFLSIGSTLHQQGAQTEQIGFSSAANGQELYSLIDAGFRPTKFVFGNVAYSIGITGGVFGQLRSLARGEVKQYSEVFNATRHLALQRIQADARATGANSVVGIRTSILPFRGMQEMMMLGTAAYHPALPPEYTQNPVTSDLTCEETWNLIQMGYAPIQLVLGVSVYSLGVIGGITSKFKALSRGEIDELTSLIYEARENAISHILRDAKACGADDVAGIKTYVYALGGGLIEFMAIGTAVKRIPGVATLSQELPPQAIIEDKTTFYNTAEVAFGANVSQQGRTNQRRDTGKDKGPVTAWDVVKIVLRIIGG